MEFSTPDPSTVGENFARVREEISAACRRAGRDEDSVSLISVSKTFPVEAIEPVIAVGHQAFGENRVQEAKAKWPALKMLHPDLCLHLLGPLQTNKVREAVTFFDAIQSLDRVSLCEALARECQKLGRQPQLFVQVNTGVEPQKAGVQPEAADTFVSRCQKEFGLRVSGLMCIPPVHERPEPHFAALSDIAARNGLPYLSMGMSSDFATAIEHGATHVRVGSAIFGSRQRSRLAQ